MRDFEVKNAKICPLQTPPNNEEGTPLLKLLPSMKGRFKLFVIHPLPPPANPGSVPDGLMVASVEFRMDNPILP